MSLGNLRAAKINFHFHWSLYIAFVQTSAAGVSAQINLGIFVAS